MTVIVALFWLCLFAVAYAYIGYSGLLWVIAQIRERPVSRDEVTPFVSLVISAYNEEGVLGKKIENSLALDYPHELLEIAVVSDGSTDRTNEIILEYTKLSGLVTSFVFPVNRGKTGALNDSVPRLRGEIIIFSDANSF